MGESLNSVLESVQSFLNFETIATKIDELINMLPAPILELYQTHTVVSLLAVACILALLAFEGYKIFKMALYACSAIIFGLVGFWHIAPNIPDNIKAMIPEIVEFNVLIAIVGALLALLICKCAYSLMIMILGGAVGYLVGSTIVYDLLLTHFDTLEFLQMDMVKHIVGGAIATVMALLFVLLFKHAFIIGTSFGGTVGAALIVQSILLPAADDNMKICFVILGIVLGIFGLVRQYREEEKAYEIVF